MNLAELVKYLAGRGFETSKPTLSREITRGKLRAVRMGKRKIEVSPANADAYLRQNATC